MATDFLYGGKQIVAGGPFKPSGKNMPVDARSRVETHADISSIPNPFIGMRITVLVDETNNNKMTDYIVKSLKANTSGVANMAINEVVRYVDYLGVSSGGGSSSGSGSIDTSNLASDLSLSGTSLQLKNSNGNLIGNAVKLPTTSGSTSVDLTNYPTRTEVLEKTNSTAFTPTSDYNPATKKYVDDSINNLSIESGNITLTDYVVGCSLKLAEIEPVYGSLNLSTNSISGNEGTTATFTVKLNSAPNTTQIVDVACGHAYIYLTPQKLTFNPSNYNTAQTVTISLLEDPTYTDWETSITVSSLGTSTQTINVSVTNTTKEPVAITGISLNKSSLTLNEGSSETLTATITPSDADTGYAWKSSATNIAIVENGLITAVAEGSATITCYSVENETIKAECAVTVAAVAIESITLPETATVNRNRTITLTPTIVPSGLTSYAWSIDNENASVNNGVVTGVTAGTSVVTCYSTKNSSIKDTTTVTIEELPITSITLDPTASIIKGKTVTLTPTIAPSDATVGYSWSTNNANVNVDNGVVTGVTVGTSVVTCYSNADNSIKAECTITINEKPVVNIDNIAIKDKSLIAVFDARDGSNEEQTAKLTNRIDNSDFAFNLTDFEYTTSSGFTDDNTIKFLYHNIPGVSNPNKITITLPNSMVSSNGLNTDIVYPNQTLMFAVKNVIPVAADAQNPYLQFFSRGSGNYGVGLSMRPTGLYCSKAFAEEGSLVTDDLTGNYHIAMCWDISNKVIKIYINGQLKIDYPFSSAQSNGAYFNIAKFYTTINNLKRCTAELAFFSVYNRVLTSDEILQNYNAYTGV